MQLPNPTIIPIISHSRTVCKRIKKRAAQQQAAPPIPPAGGSGIPKGQAPLALPAQGRVQGGALPRAAQASPA
ncbi:hypothetical protein D7X33_16050 [Butyricicoccus sp. 1XD8-22]|nr:hypothetical protein D7X33_16050 [Butyricicoccus sp. 1XD8-22]